MTSNCKRCFWACDTNWFVCEDEQTKLFQMFLERSELATTDTGPAAVV